MPESLTPNANWSSSVGSLVLSFTHFRQRNTTLGLPFVEPTAAIRRRKTGAVFGFHELDIICTHSISFNEPFLLLVPVQLTSLAISYSFVACEIESSTTCLLRE
jgi:hypothetical protein